MWQLFEKLRKNVVFLIISKYALSGLVVLRATWSTGVHHDCLKGGRMC